MKEVWKPIVGYEGFYEVSNLGRVKSLRSKTGKEKILKPVFNYAGYNCVNLYDSNRKMKTLRIHRLVATAFLPNPNNYPQVNHRDGNKNNNSVQNIEWCTALQNVRHSYETGLNKGVKNHPAKSKPVDMLTKDNVLIRTFPSGREAARQTGLFQSSINYCCTGRQRTTGGYKFRYSESVQATTA